MKAFLKWFHLDSPDRTTTVSQRVLDVSESDFRAIMPLRVAKTQILGQTILIPLETNLYKKTMSTSANSIAWTHRLMEGFGCNLKKSYSVGLWDGTQRVMIVDDDYRYATTREPDVCGASPVTVARAEKYPPSWSGSCADYDFTVREKQPQADAIITDRSDVTLCVYSADCVIALIYDRKHHAVGILHSMWRNMVGCGLNNIGTPEKSIIEETVYQMTRNFDSNPEDLEVMLFPNASPENYEVGASVAEVFRTRELGSAVWHEEGKYFLNLRLAARKLFLRCGVLDKNIAEVPFSTDDPEFSSLRNAQKGRSYQNAMIASEDDVDLSGIQRTPVKLGNENWQNVLIVKTQTS